MLWVHESAYYYENVPDKIKAEKNLGDFYVLEIVNFLSGKC